jgi:tetratricopeptide (TPR) repeat protein
MRIALKIALALGGIALPFITNSDDWWVGLLFGGVVLVWDTRSFRQLMNVRSAVFLACSTAIFVLAEAFARREMLQQTQVQHWLVSPFFVAVFAGGMLLAAAHGAVLRASWQRVAIAAPGIFAVWYLNLRLMDVFWGTVDLRTLIALWQGLYLLFMLDAARQGEPAPRSFHSVSAGAGLLAVALVAFFPHAALGQSGSIEIAGVRPGVSTRAEVDLKYGEPRVKSDNRTFEYAPPSTLPGVQRVVVTYFTDTTQVARLDVYLTNPVLPETARADSTLGVRTMVRDRARGEQEELYANSLRGLILSSKAPDAQAAALSYLSGRWLSDLYADRFHEYMREKRYADARVEADKAVAIDPDYARGYLMQGEYFQSQKNDDEAIVRYIAATNAKYPPVYLASGHLFLITEYGLKKKWLDKAQAEFQKALSGATNTGQRVEAHVAYANVLRDQKRDPDALKELNAALEVNRNSTSARSALADYFWDKHDYRSALPHYQALARAQDDAPTTDDTPQRNRLEIYFRQAYSTVESGDRDHAISLYQKVLTIDPKHTATLNNLGNIYRDTGRMNEALDTYRTGLASSPNDVYLLNSYAHALVLAGKFEEARQQAIHELSLKPKDGAAMLNMARAWAAEGKKKDALEWLRKAAATGYHDGTLESDRAFEKIRGDNDFKTLLGEMK